jgi:hypothetical protein
MRVVIGVVLVGLALCGCGDKPPKDVDDTEPAKPTTAKQQPVEPASLAGKYVGTLTGEERPEDSPLPPSIREVVGDAVLTLTAENQRFTMTHKGLNLEGTYKVDKDQLVLQVERVEGVNQDSLATVDLAANKKAGKEPSNPEMLKLFQEILFLTDWRFKLTKDGFDQLGTGSSPPRYQFKRKLD